MTDLPPFPRGGAPGLTCSRSFGDDHCRAPATHHVIWTADLVNGLCCDEHMAEACETWTFVAEHLYDPVCSIAGAVYVWDENRCVVPDSGLLVAEAIGIEKATP